MEACEPRGNAALWIGCFLVCALVALGHILAGPSRRRRIASLGAPAPVLPDPIADVPAVAEPAADPPAKLPTR